MSGSLQQWVRNVIQDPNDPESVILDLGWDLCHSLGWQEGDVLGWKDNGDGTWTITKQK